MEPGGIPVHPARMNDGLAPRASRVPLATITLLFCALAVAIGWTGFIASDDTSYYLGALEWLRDPPFAGGDHWTTRFPVVLSLAAAIRGAGDGTTALGLTALGWYAAFLAAAALLAHRIAGARVAGIATLLLGTLPLVATSASIVNCDLPEATFLLLGAWLLAREAAHGRSGSIAMADSRAAFAAGASFGLAVLCRETAVLGLAGVGLLFLLGRPVSRASLLVAAAGGALVLGGEILFQLLVTGDPLHRYALAFNHDSALDRAANLEGNLLVHPAVDPLLVLFVNNEFALLFWLGAAAVAARFDRRLDDAARRASALLAAMGLAAFLLVSLLGGKLVLNPRYFTICAVAAAIAVACWVAPMRPGKRWSVLGLAVGFNLLMLSVQNADPHWPSQALVRAAAAHPGRTVVAAPETVRRAGLPIGWAGLRNVAPAPALSLVLAPSPVPARSLVLAPDDAAPAGRTLARYPSPPTVAGGLVRALGLEALVPGPFRKRLMNPNPDMRLVAPVR